MATFPSKVNYATGDVLTAANMNDVGGALNLLESAQYAAGKNKIINGDFAINQRGFTTLGGGYGFDRWAYAASGSTGTYTPQTFALGTAPVAGYEGKNFARLAVTTGNDFARLEQKIESVRTFAGQTITISFWAKGTNPTTAGNLALELRQDFGTGGSPSTTLTNTVGNFVLTANWTRYSFTYAVASIAGKTIGTDNNDNLNISFGQGTSVSTDAWTLDLWGVQVEAASTASPFQTASGSIGGELALCQRYYQRSTAGTAFANFGTGSANSTTNCIITVPLITSMRVVPSSLEYSTLILGDGTGTNAISALVISQTTQQIVQIEATSTLLVSLRFYRLLANNSTSGYLAFSAEL